MSEDGIQKSAILLMAIGEEEAAEVLKFMGPKEVQKVSLAMSKLPPLTREQVQIIMQEFIEEAAERTTLGMSADGYIRAMLTKALGTDKAASVLDQILQAGGDTAGIEALKWMDSASIAEMIKNEHPQIVATILVNLDKDQASEILSRFVERNRNDIMMRIATLDGVQPHAMRELNDVLNKLFAGGEHGKKGSGGGVKTAADILNYMGGTLENSVLGGIKEFDEELAQKIQDEMFVFEDLIKVDDRGIQLLLREVQSESLIIALKGASEEMREKIFKNMSQRAGEMLRDDLEAKGPVRISEVEQEQKEILKIARRLADEGQIQLGGGEESFV
ncbi:MAG: flagellar motor switch protein FliG [Nitrosomonadales bacterium]|jgi:flagellar motor switch protein FliG|nr:MAG: flagellar motor switch protein FliG [Nitrosomonadales bacterium]